MESNDTINTEAHLIVVKGRLKAKSMNLYGQFILFFNNEKKLEKYDAVVSTYSEIYDLEPHNDWDKNEGLITKTKWEGNYNKSMTNALMAQLKKLSEDSNYLIMLYENIDNYDYDNMDLMLLDIVNRVITDKNLILETGIQEVSMSEVASKREASQKPKEEVSEKQADAQNNYNVVIPVKAILSPVKGRPIYELKIGHKIMVNVIPNNEKAKYFIDLMKLRNEDKIKPTPGEVIDIKMGPGKKDPIEILTDLGSGIFGKIIEEEKQVKLKTYDPREDSATGITKKATFQEEKKPFFSIGTVIMISILVFIIGLLAVWLIKM